MSGILFWTFLFFPGPTTLLIYIVRLITTIMIDAIYNSPSITHTDVSSCATVAHDHHHLAFHIASDDYFPYLSALLSCIEETLVSLDTTGEMVQIQVEAIRATRQDLQYLQNRFRIQPRS